MFEQLGTPSYMAPELWERDDSKAYTSAVDMWALGVCAYMLLSGTKPFYHKDLEQRRWLIRHKQLEFPAADWAHVSADAKDFCQRMLRKKAHSRPSASEALALPWITKRSTVHAGPDAAHEMARHSKVLAFPPIHTSPLSHSHLSAPSHLVHRWSRLSRPSPKRKTSRSSPSR